MSFSHKFRQLLIALSSLTLLLTSASYLSPSDHPTTRAFAASPTPKPGNIEGFEIHRGEHQEPVAPLSEQTLPVPNYALEVNAPAPLGSFAGIGMEPDNNPLPRLHTPPDTHAAAGFDRIVEVTNGHVAIYAKNGALLAGGDSGPGAIDLDDFCGDTSPEPRCFDTKVIYDQYANRFVAIALDGKSSSEGKLRVMVSKNAQPGNLTTAWDRYSTPTGTNISGNSAWLDYPGLGLSPEALVVTGNLFGDDFPFIFSGTKIRIFDKAELYDGDSTVNYTDINNAPSMGFTIQPAHHFGPLPAGNFYLLNRENSATLRVWKLSGLPGAPTASSAFVSTNNQGGCVQTAPQKGTTEKRVDTVCIRMMNAVWREGSLWGTLTGSTDGDTRALVHWFEVDTGAPASPALLQQGVIDGGAGEYTYTPAITVDSCGNAAIVYTQSSNARFPEMRYTGRLSTNPLNIMQSPVIAKTSAGYHDDFGGTSSAPSRERWGDYAAAMIDPTDDSFWLAHEYVKLAPVSGDDSRWGTWHTHFTYACRPPFPDTPAAYLPLVFQNSISAPFLP